MNKRGVPAQTVYSALEQYFRPHECTDIFDPIGLQFHGADYLWKVYTATFAAVPVIEEVLSRGERGVMLFTHHPRPQKPVESGDYPAIPQHLVEGMKEREITLFSYHIPLDRNSEYSPGNTLAKALGLRPYGAFYHQNQVDMGVLCESDFAALDQLVDKVENVLGHSVKSYPYGGEALCGGRVAIMAGGAKNAAIYDWLRQQGVNAFLTGVTNPDIAWAAENHRQAQRHGVSLIGGGHYSTEKFAPMEMLRFFEKLGLEGEFLPEETNLSDL